jgi:hypothetical protein
MLGAVKGIFKDVGHSCISEPYLRHMYLLGVGAGLEVEQICHSMEKEATLH